jgi:F-type H+-transporting ATPase subunit delta
MSSLIKNSQLAKHYAKNVYEVANDSASLDAVRDSFKLIQDSLLKDANFNSLCHDKTLNNKDLSSFFSELLDKLEFADIANNLIKILVENGRIYLLAVVIEEFFKLDAKMQGEVDVKVTAAHALTEAQSNNIKVALESAFNSKVSINVEVDASLIAGIKIKYGSLEMDASAYGRLNAMRQSLNSSIERAVVN